MRIQLVNTYLKMMDEGLVPYITCGGDADHPRPFVRLSEDEEGLELWCLACSWVRILGLRDYEHMKNLLTLHGIFEED